MYVILNKLKIQFLKRFLKNKLKIKKKNNKPTKTGDC